MSGIYSLQTPINGEQKNLTNIKYILAKNIRTDVNHIKTKINKQLNN